MYFTLIVDATNMQLVQVPMHVISKPTIHDLWVLKTIEDHMNWRIVKPNGEQVGVADYDYYLFWLCMLELDRSIYG